MTKKACARQPWRIVEIQSCVLPYALAYCLVLLYLIARAWLVFLGSVDYINVTFERIKNPPLFHNNSAV